MSKNSFLDSIEPPCRKPRAEQGSDMATTSPDTTPDSLESAQSATIKPQARKDQ